MIFSAAAYTTQGKHTIRAPCAAEYSSLLPPAPLDADCEGQRQIGAGRSSVVIVWYVLNVSQQLLADESIRESDTAVGCNAGDQCFWYAQALLWFIRPLPVCARANLIVRPVSPMLGSLVPATLLLISTCLPCRPSADCEQVYF